MPPRIDPYANKTHRRIDIALIVLTLAMMLIAFRVFAHERANHNLPAPQAQEIAHK
ncbi:MAG TPA: hypothetical protein VH170_04615 [Chthoniobacterales bacterium]|jgi:hypothetical protein|nr:hypothetical protein [Chthoniobacterales bacterium]